VPLKFNFFFIFATSLSLLTFACAKSDSPKASVYWVDEDHSCDFKATDGGAARLYQQNLQTTLFGKTFDRGHLNSVMEASAVNTAAYIRNNLNTNVYAVDTAVQAKCDFYSFLPNAPSDLNTHFQSLTFHDPKMFVAGLFLQSYSPNLPSTNGTAAILVMKKSDRWKIVHEMMHDLFEQNIARESHRYNSTHDLVNLLNKDEAITNQITDKSSIQYSTAVANLEEDVNDLIVRTSLEEVTIETELSKLYLNGLLQFIPYSAGSSQHYIKFSLEVAMEGLNWFFGEYLPDHTPSATLARETDQRYKLMNLRNDVSKMRDYYSDSASQNVSARSSVKAIENDSEGAATLTDAHLQRMADITKEFTHHSRIQAFSR
jgi:hypothetical protein